MEDMRLMGVMKPDMLTRVSEYTDKIVTYIETIIENGYAYESNGSVYFDVPAFEGSDNHKYAKLNKGALDDVELAMDGEGALAADASEKKAGMGPRHICLISVSITHDAFRGLASTRFIV